ncbi:hypothetical protein BaRGS_00035856 [Batillaria attramentaria]|uniref:Uncharacterized protein n=1 Tax=Batillaria attramentaria TaxID=370345 RepID=A0ABD0JDB6_9CAEN
MATIGVALFGIGRVGQIHLGNLVANSDVTVRWLVDVEASREKALELCSLYKLEGNTRFATADNYEEEVFSDASTHAVVICTPTRFHEEAIKRAVKAGKDVFCEKPLSFTSDVVKSCYAEAQKHGRILFCAFNRRFDPDHVRVRDKLNSGQLGTPRVVHYNARDPKMPASYIKSSGGIFCDACIHWLDYIPWLVGERPCSVVATGGRTSEAKDDYELADDVDSTLITLQFPSGAHAVLEMTRELPIDLGWCTYVRIEVVGTKDTYFAHKVGMDTLSTVAMDGTGEETKSKLNFWSSYKLEMDCFVRVLQGKIIVGV